PAAAVEEAHALAWRVRTAERGAEAERRRRERQHRLCDRLRDAEGDRNRARAAVRARDRYGRGVEPRVKRAGRRGERDRGCGPGGREPAGRLTRSIRDRSYGQRAERADRST